MCNLLLHIFVFIYKLADNNSFASVNIKKLNDNIVVDIVYITDKKE